MGKRLIFALLALLVAFSSASCAGSVPETGDEPAITVTETGDVQILTKKTLNPMTEYPDYTLPAGATTDQIRAMVVKAMRDELSIQWVCPETVDFDKLSTGVVRSFTVQKGAVYAGLPYTSGCTGLLTWLQYYDPETGRVSADAETLTKELGNACVCSVSWGWCSVLSNVLWHNAAWEMVPKNGCVPVGPYAIDPDLRDLNVKSTYQICEENGEQVMFQSYAAMLPADVVISYYEHNGPSDHALMAVEPAHVEYKADGTIDGEKSFVAFQDQYPSYRPETRNGETVTAFGNLYQEISFNELFKYGKLPYTHVEMTGEKPYEGLKFSFLTKDGEKVTSFDDFANASIQSTHHVITVTATVTDKDGAEVGVARRISTKERFVSNGSLNYSATSLPRAGAFKGLQKGESYTYHLSALMATGRTVDLGEFDFTY